MAVSPDSLPSIDGTQPLRRVTAQEAATAEVENQNAETSEEALNHTVYVPLDAIGDLGVPDPVEALVESKSSSTAIRKIAGEDVTDPAELVQIQALEIAANRAEIARHIREQEDLQRALRLREGWLADMRKELEAVQEERRVLAAQLAEAQRNIEEMTKRIEQQAQQIATLEAQAAERMSVTVFASENAPRTRPAATPARSSEPLDVANPATLMPLDDNSAPIVLDRKVMTVGRTRDTDICIPSVLVSRDHARLLVSEDNVTLFDVGSINGSFVNEQPIKRQTLKDGDIVRFADRRYRFCG